MVRHAARKSPVEAGEKAFIWKPPRKCEQEKKAWDKREFSNWSCALLKSTTIGSSLARFATPCPV